MVSCHQGRLELRWCSLNKSPGPFVVHTLLNLVNTMLLPCPNLQLAIYSPTSNGVIYRISAVNIELVIIRTELATYSDPRNVHSCPLKDIVAQHVSLALFVRSYGARSQVDRRISAGSAALGEGSRVDA